jgi:hypothetical protein
MKSALLLGRKTKASGDKRQSRVGPASRLSQLPVQGKAALSLTIIDCPDLL